jgi:hypothetical protein
MTVIPITIRRFAPCFRLRCTISHNRSCIVGNFVDNQPNVPCICHIFFETPQDTNRKLKVFKVIVAQKQLFLKAVKIISRN